MDSSIEEIREMIDTYKPYIPLVEEIVDELVPVLDKICDRLLQYARKQTIESLKYYEAQALSHEDAMLLTISGNVALAEMVKNMGRK